ncbi:MAG TPA: bifunctional NADP phosphatase/NAD kinase, partial [Methanothermococcus okinawensis]|nr:bifunctional NADP phosphatase/NAD kinase [Methanothermococcus okinawensis]
MFHIARRVVDSIEKGIKPLIGWERSGEVIKIGADGTPTKRIDVIAENIAVNSIERYCNAILISEEIGVKKIGEEPPEYLIVLDPIDGTYNALNNLPIYSVSIAMGEIPQEIGDSKDILHIVRSMNIEDLKLGMVKNIATGDIYYGIVNSGAYILEKNEREWKKIKVSDTKNLKDASLGVFAYGLTTNTLNFIKDRKVRRIRIFGSVALEMCYVARGALDAFINVNKTTRLCDIAGGYVILKEAGGVITDRDGKPISMKLDIHERTSLICSNTALHQKLVGIFGNKWMLKPTRFGIISRLDKEEALDLVIQVINYLESRGIDYLLERELYNTLKDKVDIRKYKGKVMEDLKDVSHMLSIGGDGTVLRTSRLIGGNEIPIISIDMGTVGFLTEFSRDGVFKAIDMVIKGNYEIEKRTKCA